MIGASAKPGVRLALAGLLIAGAAAAIYFAFRDRKGPLPASPARSAGAYAAPPAIPAPDEPPPDLEYVDVTAASGVACVHETGARGKKLLPETMGAGCAFLDYDGDGDPDLYLPNGDYWSDDPRRASGRPAAHLYRNDGGFRFTDVTGETGLDAPFYGMGCSAGDTDGDGDADLVVTGVGGYRFFRNDAGRFTDVTADSGLAPGTWKDETGAEHGCFATSAAFLDYDKDGLPDLFVCHYVRWSEATDIWSTMDGRTKSYATPAQYQGESCRLWRNLGGNRFEDRTDAARVRNDEGKSLGVCVLDIEDDGWPDIAVANDTQPNYLYRNNKDGTFTDIGLSPAGIAYGPDGRARAGMGIDCGPLGADQRLSVAIGNFSGEPVSVFEQLPGRPDILVNKSDQLGVAVVTHAMLTFGILIIDADQDGWNDLVLANGHIEPTIQSVHKETPYAEPMQLLRNLKGRRFSDLSKSVGAGFAAPRVGRALACADVDGDGDLDLCETVNGGRPVLLRCDAPPGRSLRVTLRGRAPATGGLGARVTVKCGDKTVSQRVRTGRSYLAASETVLTFALETGTAATAVFVAWPGAGGKDDLAGYDGPFPGGTRLLIDQDLGIVSGR